jgi:hypothetical protein
LIVESQHNHGTRCRRGLAAEVGSLLFTHSSRTRFVASRLLLAPRAGRLNSGVRHCKVLCMKVKDLFPLIFFGALAIVGYEKYKSHQAESAQLEAVPVKRPVVLAPTIEDRSWIKPRDNSATASSGSSSQCDGRTRCPQMRSCAEATYFIQHCPNTQMDGDHDGVPCEEQWC